MAWAKFDDRWATHPKLLAAGLEAKGLDASGICYCAGQETDGFVPDNALTILGAGHRNPRKVAERLVEVGRWSRDDERKGYLIHDFDVYNFTRAQGEAKRTRDAERKAAARSKQGRDAKGRITSGQTDEDVRTDTDDCPGGFHDESEWTPTLVPPVPTRPDPTPTDVDQSSSSNSSVGAAPDEEEEIRNRRTTAVGLVAERQLANRLARTDLPPVSDRPSWLKSARAKVWTDHGSELDTLALQNLPSKAIADRLMPAQPGPYAGLDEPRLPVWDEAIDEAGQLVAVPRRSAS